MVEEIFLDWLIDKSWEYQTLALPNPSVGAMVVNSFNYPISYAIHQKCGEAHAELEAIKLALIALGILKKEECEGINPWKLHELILSSHQNALKDCSIFITLEPCNHEGKTPSCTKLIEGTGIKNVYFGSWDLGLSSGGGGAYLREKGINVYGGICRTRSDALIYPFKCLREKGHFNLYKIAQRLNANYKDGQISDQDSKAFTHTQRGVADALIISGKTVLNDHPRLDLRCAFRKDKEDIAIKILTQRHLRSADLSFICSKDIKVFHDIDSLGLNSGFNLIEGGYGLLQSLKESLDAILLILAPTFAGESEKITQKFDLKVLHTAKKKGDVFLWLQT